MKKYLVLFAVILIGSSVYLGRVEAETFKNTSKVGITFVNDKGEDLEQISKEENNNTQDKGKLPSTGEKDKSSLALLGLCFILLAMFSKKRCKENEKKL